MNRSGGDSGFRFQLTPTGQRTQSRVLRLRPTRRIKLVRTATSLPSRVSYDAQTPIIIDSSEVKQYVTALWRASSMVLPKL
jgi:hypothetical protein